MYCYLTSDYIGYRSKFGAMDVLLIIITLLRIFYLPVLYLICKNSKNKTLADFMQKWRNDSCVKFDIFVVISCIVPLTYLIVLINFVNIFGVMLWGVIISFYCFCLPSLFSIALLYSFWLIYDVVFKHKIKTSSLTIQNDGIVIEDCDAFKEVKTCWTPLIVILGVFTNNLYSIFYSLYLKKKLNIYTKDGNGLDRAYFNYILMIIVSYLLIAVTALISFIFGKIDPTINILFDCLSLFLLFLTYVFIIFSGLTYMLGTYFFTDNVLTMIENYTKEKYNKVIRHNRIYAFLFGICYLNYALNSYQERMKNRLKTEKFVRLLRFDYIFYAFMAPFMLFVVVYLLYLFFEAYVLKP